MQTKRRMKANQAARAMRKRQRLRRVRLFQRSLLFLTMLAVVCGGIGVIARQKTVRPMGVASVASAPVATQEIEPYTIVLDSGHSTYNVGAHGLVKEEDITAKTTEYLRQLLEQDEHFTVILTHEYDVHASVAERREVGITSNCDFFLSIHCNALENDTSVSGFEVYAQLPENAHHAESYAVARDISQQFITAGHHPRDGSGIFYCRYVPDENGEDIHYTLTEQQEAETNYGGETYGVIKSDSYPGVLIEQGFVTSATDVANWMRDDGTQRAAEIYYQALCNYFGV